MRPAPSAGEARIERGRDLVRQARCGACHTLPKSVDGTAIKPVAIRMPATQDDTESCLFEPQRTTHRPGYRLTANDRRMVTAFLSDIAGTSSTPRIRTGKQLLAEHNCLACHARGLTQGLAARLPEIGEADPTLRDVLPALAPPRYRAWAINCTMRL